MLFKSQIFTQASGSIGGTTFSRNRGGMYIRGRGLPTNPNSAAQVAARDAMSTLVDRWTQILTNLQREAWKTYADNTPVINRLGDSIKLTGQQMYVRSNQPRLRAGLAVVDDGPVLFDLGTFTTPTLFISAAAPNDIGVTFDIADEWANNDDAALIALSSRGQNATVNFFKAPFRLAGNIAGADLGITSPKTVISEFPYGEGQKVFVSFRASQADGRLSNNAIIDTIVVA